MNLRFHSKNKIISLVMCVIFLGLSLLLSSCTINEKKDDVIRANNLKIGFITSDEEDSVNAELHIKALDNLVKTNKLKSDNIYKKTNVSKDQCYAVAKELVENGCRVIFISGSSLEDYIVQVATEKPNVQFCIAKGTKKADKKLENLHIFSVAESESRYLSGVVAGMKLNDMISNGEISDTDIKIGYVGSIKNDENTSSYTAYYLGVKSVCENVTMQVQYAGIENNPDMERIAANALIANGCVLISQQSYTNGAAETCENNNVYFVGNYQSATDQAPNFALTSSTVNWNSNYEYVIKCLLEGEKISLEWSKKTDEGASGVTEINRVAFTSKEKYDEIKKKVNEIENLIKKKEIKVFDIATWTVNGEAILSTGDKKWYKDYYGVEYIEDGCFKEFENSSTPKFKFKIDGISEQN